MAVRKRKQFEKRKHLEKKIPKGLNLSARALNGVEKFQLL